MIYFEDGYDLAKVEQELNGCNTAAVYCKEIVIGYCEPAGEYMVTIPTAGYSSLFV